MPRTEATELITTRWPEPCARNSSTAASHWARVPSTSGGRAPGGPGDRGHRADDGEVAGALRAEQLDRRLALGVGAQHVGGQGRAVRRGGDGAHRAAPDDPRVGDARDAW